MKKDKAKSQSASPSPRKRGRPPKSNPAPNPPSITTKNKVCELTKVLDAPSIRSHAQKLFQQAKTTGTPLTAAIIDGDDFAEINDIFGLDRGDLFLKELATRISKHKNVNSKRLGRLSGDIFLLLLPDIEPEEAFLKLEHVRAAVADTPISSGRGASFRKHQVTVSIGLAGYPKDGSDLKTVLFRAMAAARRAKRLGKNRVGLPPDDNMVTKTSHYPKTQLEALRALAQSCQEGEASLLREALEDLLLKYKARP
ncbi:MAG: GGDEF domain-containing protein [Planctomycetota bacterium]|nr:GGDEF domain-containing protein [Planctomycetota bacterium]